MNKWILMASVMVFSVAGVVSAETKEDLKAHPKGSTHEAVSVGNKICPVSQEPVGEMGEPVVYEYKGMKINFCCKACVKDFEKNPEKYIEGIMKEIHTGVEGYSSDKDDKTHEHNSHRENE